MKSLALLTEDELSEAVGLRILAEVCPEMHVDPILRRNGFGYLRSKMVNWSQMANYQPVLLITDLDRKPCPQDIIKDWFGILQKRENFLFRVAVKEIESWILADHIAMRSLFGKKGTLPENSDDLSDPKNYLLNLAKKASREVRYDLVREEGSATRQGIAYNSRLVALVRDMWCPKRAAERSRSLNKAISRIRNL